MCHCGAQAAVTNTKAVAVKPNNGLMATQKLLKEATDVNDMLRSIAHVMEDKVRVPSSGMNFF